MTGFAPSMVRMPASTMTLAPMIQPSSSDARHGAVDDVLGVAEPAEGNRRRQSRVADDLAQGGRVGRPFTEELRWHTWQRAGVLAFASAPRDPWTLPDAHGLPRTGRDGYPRPPHAASKGAEPAAHGLIKLRGRDSNPRSASDG